jgi:uncharacterized membrane protein YcaP (DUF421 family)
MPTFLEVLIQSLVAFVILLFLARFMGKRQIAQLTYFDYIVGITIGNIAGAWSLDEVKSIHALCSILIWGILPILLAVAQRKSYRARMILDGSPTTIIQDGKVLDHNLKKVGLAIEEMMLLLRDKDVFKVSDVQDAILETNGSLSVLKKSELQPVSRLDAGIPTVSERQPVILIIDGHVMEKALQKTGYTKEWLQGEVMAQGGRDVQDVFLAQVDSNGSLYVDLYLDELKEPQIKAKPLCAASLKKLQADMETFAFETDNPSAKAMYSQSASRLDSLLNEISPFLKD